MFSSTCVILKAMWSFLWKTVKHRSNYLHLNLNHKVNIINEHVAANLAIKSSSTNTICKLITILTDISICPLFSGRNNIWDSCWVKSTKIFCKCNNLAVPKLYIFTQWWPKLLEHLTDLKIDRALCLQNMIEFHNVQETCRWLRHTVSHTVFIHF